MPKAIQILTHHQIERKIARIAHQIHEHNYEEKAIVIAGIASRGYVFAQKVAAVLDNISNLNVTLSELNIDKDNPHEEHAIGFSINPEQLTEQSVVLADDVLNSGRTLIYGVRYLLAYPLKQLKIAVLVDRSHKRYPVHIDYTGLSLSTTLKEHVSVEFSSDGDRAYLV
jgi:pyrimidine operon attenuation protein/uracil phosphoribosyltransferase